MSPKRANARVQKQELPLVFEDDLSSSTIGKKPSNVQGENGLLLLPMGMACMCSCVVVFAQARTHRQRHQRNNVCALASPWPNEIST